MAVCTIERTSPSPQDSESEDQGSLSSHEGFVCREGCVFSLSPRPGVSVGKHGVMPLRIMSHLKKVVKMMRPQDSLKLAVELEQNTPRAVSRYMTLIVTLGLQDTEEAIILGTEQGKDNPKVCLVLPLLRDTEIKLNGDGGFSVHSYDKEYNFKPCSVQSMWTVLQSVFKAIEQARTHNYFVGGLSHTWMTYYQAQLTDDGISLNEWSVNSDLSSFRPDSPIYFDATGGELNLLSSEKENFRKFLVAKLRETMLHCDLDLVTSKQLRIQLENEISMDLKEYRGYLDQQMLVILGQMEKPSRIHDYLYLGSEWNATDLVGLKELGVGYILNVTKEIDNFYPEVFKYKAIRLYDVPQSELLMHWESTYNFIKEAKEANSKVLVHCKMGISRSAATTIAFTMKEYRMTLNEAFKHVKSCRAIINPNHGFMNQLKSYEGILSARYNSTFGYLVPSRLTFQSRSISDNNIRQKLFDKDSETEEPQQQTDMTKQDDELHLQMKMDSQVDQALEHKVVKTLPPEKVHGMMNYLAYLPVPDEDQDLGIMVPSPSDSGSPYSSPLLTPPDIEGVQLALRDFQEAERERLLREKGQGNEETSSNTLLPHARVSRAVSLPTSIHPLSSEANPNPLQGEAYPRTTPLTELSEETPKEEVKITLTQSVTERVQEIEKKHLRSDRPASAGSRKYMSGGSGGGSGIGGCLSLASSEESLSIKKLVSDDSCLLRDKRRSMSPVTLKIPENDSPSENNESCSLPPPANTGSPLSPDNKMATQTSHAHVQQHRPLSASKSVGNSPDVLNKGGGDEDRCSEGNRLRDMHSESPPPSSSSSYLYMSADTNQYIDTDSTKSATVDTGLVLLGNDDESEGMSQADPGRMYELARKRSLILSEVRNKNKMQGGSGTSATNSLSKGVSELRCVFGEEKKKGSKLKRSQSLNEKIPVHLISKHKRNPSVSLVSPPPTDPQS